MDLTELLDECTGEYKAMKDEYATSDDWAAPASDLPLRVEAFIDDRPLAMALVRERDEGLFVAQMLRLFGANRITLAMDAHMKKMSKEEYEKDGPPAPGSLQEACHNQGACERGEITDTLVVYAIDAQQDIVRMLPYGLHADEPHVFWAEEEPTDAGNTTGLVVETLRDAMKVPTAAETLIELNPPADLLDPLTWTMRAKAIDEVRKTALFTALALTEEETEQFNAGTKNLEARVFG